MSDWQQYHLKNLSDQGWYPNFSIKKLIIINCEDTTILKIKYNLGLKDNFTYYLEDKE